MEQFLPFGKIPLLWEDHGENTGLAAKYILLLQKINTGLAENKHWSCRKINTGLAEIKYWSCRKINTGLAKTSGRLLPGRMRPFEAAALILVTIYNCL